MNRLLKNPLSEEECSWKRIRTGILVDRCSTILLGPGLCHIKRRNALLVRHILQNISQLMQQKKVQVCIHKDCLHSPFVTNNPNIEGQDRIQIHHDHSLIDWDAVLTTAKKCTTDDSLARHFKELIDKVQKFKESLDVVLSMHIQKLSNSRFKAHLSGPEEVTLAKILTKERNEELTGRQLHYFINATSKKGVILDFGLHLDQEQTSTLFKSIEDSFAAFKESNKKLAKDCLMKGWEKWTEIKGAEAIDYYSRALELYPEHCQAYFQRGFAYHSMGEDVLAQNDYNNCLRICPQHASSLTNRGYIQSRRGNKAKALEWYTKALQVNPNDTVSYNNRGYIYFALYRYTDALRDVTRSIELKPSKDSYKFRAEIYTKLGRRSEALRDLEAARKL